jgi:integrase
MVRHFEMYEFVDDNLITEVGGLAQEVDVERESAARRAARPLSLHVSNVNLLRLDSDPGRPTEYERRLDGRQMWLLPRSPTAAPELSRELAKHSLGSSFSGDDDFVFTTETGAPMYYRNVSARGLDKAADQAGLNPEGVQKLSFHDLRHTAITHLIRSGADPAQVSRFAGHSKVSTTLDLYVGEWEKRRVNDSGTRLAAIYAGGTAPGV